MAGQIDRDDILTRATAAASAWSPGARVVDYEPFPTGASSVTVLATLEGGPAEHPQIVLKIAPPGVPPTRNRDVLRQARLLKAIHSAPGVRVPEVLFEDPGQPDDIPPFFAMRYVAGETVDPIIGDEPPEPPLDELTDRLLVCARMAAALHAIDPVKVGFADEPVIGMQDEVERWFKALDSVKMEPTRGYDEVGALLRESAPEPIDPAIIHGDWRLGNTLSAGHDVLAAIDWEIWSLSDPRIDLGWFLLTYDPEWHPSAKRSIPGLPTPADLLAEYNRAGGNVDPGDMKWFKALNLYKMAAAVSIIGKNAGKRGEDEKAERAFRDVPTMLANSRRYLSEGS